MVRLTCLLRRKPGLTPEEFHDHWRNVHGPLVARTKSGSYVIRYEQHPRPLSEYPAEDDGGYDGVTMQWFRSSADFAASIAEPDYAEIDADVATFLDTDRLEFIITDEPIVVIGGPMSGGASGR